MSMYRNKLQAFNYIVMAFLCIGFLYPVVYTISVSLSDAKAILEGRVLFYPVGLNVEAYKALLADKSLINSFFFTVILTVSGVLINIFLTVLTAYPLSVRSLRGRRIFLTAIVFTMYFSGGLIPTYIVIKSLGLIDKMGSLILPGAINSFFLIIVIGYIQSLPEELKEAARVEGCSNVKILQKIIIPLSTPVIATIVIFSAVAFWNTFFDALIYIQSAGKYPLQIKLYQILSIFSDDIKSRAERQSSVVRTENLKGAAVVLTVFPILVVYPWLQKYFIKGVTIGALKG